MQPSAGHSVCNCIRILAALIPFFGPLPQRARANEIWLNGIDPVTAKIHNWPNAESRDFYQLFEPNAPWQNAASHVSALLVTTPFLLLTSDDILKRVFADLKRRNIALAVETTFLPNDQGCGKGVEAFAVPRTAEKLATRVRQLGGELRYIAMSEVLYYGHHFNGTNACHLAIPEIARQVAVGVAAMKRIFPNIQIGSIEVVGQTEPEDWINQTVQWIKAYETAVGEPLNFVQVDVDWFGPWREQLPQLAKSVNARGIPFGVIYNGYGSDQTGVAWTHRAEEHFVAVESGLGVAPQRAILQTWMQQPADMLPETKPGTMTWLVDRYLAAPSRIVLQRAGDNLTGQLSDGAGHPIVGATININAVARSSADITVVRTLHGVVPANAARATIALRINDECGCSGPADVTIGPVSYRDTVTGQAVLRQFRPPSGATATINGKPHFIAAAGQKMWQNTPEFAVTGGQSYTMDIPLSASSDSSSGGYVAIIFLDQHGKGLSRDTLTFQPSTQQIGTAITDASGRFALAPDPHLMAAGVGFLVEFAGNAHYRLSDSYLH